MKALDRKLLRDLRRLKAQVASIAAVAACGVLVGHRTSGFVEVTRGLAAGVYVVLFPSDNIHDGARVRSRTTN